MKKYRQNKNAEGPLKVFFMGQLAAAFFAIPTAALLWFATNQQLALSGIFIGLNGFWLIIAIFAFISIFIPRLFPSILGKVWHGLIKIEQWF